MSGVDLSPRPMIFKTTSTTIDGTVTPLQFNHPILAAELSDALIDMRRTFALADGTAYQYRTTIINLLNALPETCSRTASLASVDRGVVDAFHKWESGLASAYPAESAMP